jgi:hypothetical protein
MGAVYRYWLEGSWIQPAAAWKGGPTKSNPIPTLLTLDEAEKVAKSVSGMVYSWPVIKAQFVPTEKAS